MFNNGEFESNGEKYVFDRLKKNLTIFDVGCRSESLFLTYEGIVHYFEPNAEFLNKLKDKPNNKNIKSLFNNFGLADVDCNSKYFPFFQSFVNRENTFGVNDQQNAVLLELKTGKRYLLDNNIQQIDFLKIDTEGYEFKILLGFEGLIQTINVIQFEYGGTFKDANVKLEDVIKYLKGKNFGNFCYLSGNGMIPIKDYNDHYQYCNIICFNLKQYSEKIFID